MPKGPNKHGPKSSFHCNACGRKVRMPKGWSRGAAVRRHYWAKHRDVMTGPKA